MVEAVSEWFFTGGWWLGRVTVRQNPAGRPVNRCEVFSRFAAEPPWTPAGTHGPQLPTSHRCKAKKRGWEEWDTIG
jgi:hypothetical protein